MSQQRRPEEELRLRRVADVASGRAPAAEADQAPERDDEKRARARRAERSAHWVDFQVRQAMGRGAFDNLAGSGKPLRGLGGTHDPQWWVKRLVEREQITGVGPPALALRKEHAELDGRLDRETTEAGVRQVVDDFNHRVVAARRQLQGGPPVITPTRDPETEVQAWRARRTERRQRLRRQRARERAARNAEQEARPGWLGRQWSRWQARPQLP